MSNETVDSYAAKFKKLLAKVDPGAGIPAAQQKRMFLFGLNPLITPMVHMQAAVDLNALIVHARNAETGYNYARMGPTITGTPLTNNAPVMEATAPYTAPMTTTMPPESALAELTKQMQQLTINYANLASTVRNNNNWP